MDGSYGCDIGEMEFHGKLSGYPQRLLTRYVSRVSLSK